MGSLTNSYKFKSEGLMKKVRLHYCPCRHLSANVKALCRRFH
jgi:hypothetical protein